jgi:hypothetical protein
LQSLNAPDSSRQRRAAQAPAFEQAAHLGLLPRQGFTGAQALAHHLAVGARLHAGHPDRWQVVAAEHMAAEQREQLLGIALVGLQLLVRRRLGPPRRGQHHAHQASLAHRVVPREPQPARLVGDDQSHPPRSPGQ